MEEIVCVDVEESSFDKRVFENRYFSDGQSSSWRFITATGQLQRMQEYATRP
jgi:hypothetical protein